MIYRKYYREPIAGHTGRGARRGIALAEYDGQKYRIGMSLCSPSDSYNPIKGELAAYGRLSSGMFEFTEDEIKHIEDLLDPAFNRMVPDIKFAANEARTHFNKQRGNRATIS